MSHPWRFHGASLTHPWRLARVSRPREEGVGLKAIRILRRQPRAYEASKSSYQGLAAVNCPQRGAVAPFLVDG